MPVNVGINGFGRIGRRALKAVQDIYGDTLKITAINGRGDAMRNAHLLKHDSTYGSFPGKVESEDGAIIVNNNRIPFLDKNTPAEIPWSEYGVDIVMECTGKFRTIEAASGHISSGAKKVVISSPGEDEDVTIVLGVNEDAYNPGKHHIISNASCTTNCIAPVVKVIQDNFGVESGFMTSIHAYTNDQRLLDSRHKDLRRARAGASNIVPTTTGAARAVTKVMPELSGKLDGLAVRVPTPTVSMVDLVVVLNREATAAEINRAFQDAALGHMKGILEYTDEELVSSDFKGNSASSIVDSSLTMVMNNKVAKVLSWYDNEWGYACRLAQLCAFVAERDA